MRRLSLLLFVLSCAVATDAAAQATPSTPRRPPSDTLRIRAAADSIRMAEEGDVVSIDALDEEVEEEASADTVPVPANGPYARAQGTGPFTVQASGEPAPRPARGEVVWVNTRPARPAATDTARAGSGERVASGSTTRRDTAAASRPTPRDTARTGSGQRVSSGQTTRRDTAASRPAPRDTATVRRNNTGASTPATGRTGANAPGSRPRTHTVAQGETLFGIARRYGVTVAAIRQVNGMETDQVQTGQRLVIPPAR
jgi:membrane-bound lytic murein transglycosylase D